MNENQQRPSWVNSKLYPFESNFLRLESGNMHYVDKGEGKVILFLHGTPTWSFLYRGFIKELSKEHRCIAVDHLGFGLSDTPESFSGSPEDHAKNICCLISKLDLHNITLVVHDFGGPIGLAAAIQFPDRIQNIVLFNTWLWSTKERKDVQRIDRLINTYLGRFLYLNLNISPRVLLKQGFADKKLLPKAIHRQYIGPFPNRNSRQSLLKIAKALAGASDWYQQQWEQLDSLLEKKWLLIWGVEDPFIGAEALNRWKKRLPHAKHIELNCGHFVQEERRDASIDAIANFMSS